MAEYPEDAKNDQEFLHKYQDDVYRAQRSLPDIKHKAGSYWEAWLKAAAFLNYLRLIRDYGSVEHKKCWGSLNKLASVKIWGLVEVEIDWDKDSEVAISEDIVNLQMNRLANCEEWRHIKYDGTDLGDALSRLSQIM